ncbi:hypothetical protein EDC01DRAFT_784295 [Geopyxis carbonaria]|nr:hypothetical protein EDC01DRAFT_784295 [Geopyxis carbonaria]
MSEMLPMELMWVSFPTQTLRTALPSENQRVKIFVDHGNGGLQLRSLSGELVGWIDPFDDARAMRVLKSIDTLGKGGRVGGIITRVTVGWPNTGPRLQPAEGQMVMRLLKTGEGVFDMEMKKVAAKEIAKAVKALTRPTMAVKGGRAVKVQKVAGGRVMKRTKAYKPKAKIAVAAAEAGTGAGVDKGKSDEKEKESKKGKEKEFPESAKFIDKEK